MHISAIGTQEKGQSSLMQIFQALISVHISHKVPHDTNRNPEGKVAEPHFKTYAEILQVIFE